MAEWTKLFDQAEQEEKVDGVAVSTNVLTKLEKDKVKARTTAIPGKVKRLGISRPLKNRVTVRSMYKYVQNIISK